MVFFIDKYYVQTIRSRDAQIEEKKKGKGVDIQMTNQESIPIDDYLASFYILFCNCLLLFIYCAP